MTSYIGQKARQAMELIKRLKHVPQAHRAPTGTVPAVADDFLPTVEVDRILIMLGRRPCDPEPVRMMTRQLSPTRAEFRTDSQLRPGDEMKLIILLMPGCTLDMSARVLFCENVNGEWCGELSMQSGYYEREKIRGFLKRFRVPDSAFKR